MAYSIIDFAKSLKAENCKIQNRPDLIFLCGGPIVGEGALGSVRDFFYRHLLKEKPDWTTELNLPKRSTPGSKKRGRVGTPRFGIYLRLENYLAHLAFVTVLFVESPGSIAELGAFAASDRLRPKTIAVLNLRHPSKNSFIADGPVLKTLQTNEKHVRCYEWNSKKAGFRPYEATIQTYSSRSHSIIDLCII